MNIHMIPLHMIYATMLKRLGVRQITVFNVGISDLSI